MKDINATVIVNLKDSKEKILEGLHKDARWGINRAKREKLKVIESKEWEEIYPVYVDSMSKRGVAVESLEALKKKMHKLFVCKKDGRIIAGAGIAFTNRYNPKIPRLYFNSSLENYLKMQPNNLLYWTCILWAKENNYEEFDLGGWQINAEGAMNGVNKFKERWGEIKYFYKDYPAHIAIGRKLVRNFGIFKRINRVIKRRK